MIAVSLLSLSLLGFGYSPCELKNESLNNAVILGVASSLKEDRALYCEWHVPDENDDQSLFVYYTEVDGEIFAEKRLTFSDLEKPEFVQNDFRSDEVRKIFKTEKGWQLYYLEDSKSKAEVTPQEDGDIDVIDAGFDNVVRANWDKLSPSEAVEFDFASEVFQRTIALRVLEKELKECHSKDPKWRCFFVESSNPFLRIFTGELTLLYDEKKRLRQFEGVVNIRDENQKKQKAKIQYFYKESPLK